MDFSKLRHRVILLKPLDKKLNSMKETVPVWIPFKPNLNNNLNINEKTEVYVVADKKGNAVLKSVGGWSQTSSAARPSNRGQLYAHQLSVKEYAVWANVSPMSEREYEEAQKLREETTYKITTRYFPDITEDMKIMFGVRVLDIVSVLNIGERNTQLQIIAKEKDRNGKKC